MCTLPKPWEAGYLLEEHALECPASLPSMLEEEAAGLGGQGPVLCNHESGPRPCLPLSKEPLAISQAKKK